MITVRQKGLEEAIAKTTTLRNMLGKSARVTLDIPDEELAKLTWQAAMQRNVTNLSASEKDEVKAIVKEHVEAARDASGKVAGGEREWLRMHTALGEWMRSVIADKIEDKRPVSKRPLSPAYAAWKMARVGARPILVLTGAMLRAVRNAVVKVTSR